mmetsp:Transcript_107325/g.185827  ORF Transcript_107325/g.185827 Transcript_107325/m.185827 type:complete len:282 (-) Transcript_107325:369-1214(-)
MLPLAIQIQKLRLKEIVRTHLAICWSLSGPPLLGRPCSCYRRSHLVQALCMDIEFTCSGLESNTPLLRRFIVAHQLSNMPIEISEISRPFSPRLPSNHHLISYFQPRAASCNNGAVFLIPDHDCILWLLCGRLPFWLWIWILPYLFKRLATKIHYYLPLSRQILVIWVLPQGLQIYIMILQINSAKNFLHRAVNDFACFWRKVQIAIIQIDLRGKHSAGLNKDILHTPVTESLDPVILTIYKLRLCYWYLELGCSLHFSYGSSCSLLRLITPLPWCCQSIF